MNNPHGLRTALFFLGALLASGVSPSAGADPAAAIDGDLWRNVAVQDGGRYKPFDTLAWETLRAISNRASVVDAETEQKLGPIPVYLTMLLEWQGWNAGSHPPMGMDPAADYFRAHAADRWDESALVLVDSLEARQLLGLPATQKYVSIVWLRDAKIRNPHTGNATSFLTWARSLEDKNPKSLTLEERNGLNLAERFWMYLDHRMGQRLFLLPLPGGTQQQWISVARLLQTKWDSQSDPGGGIRQAQETFRQMRTAFRGNQAAAFQQAAAKFIATLRSFGPQLGTYPSQATIDLEVLYNHLVPFRIAWCLTLLSVLVLLVGQGAHWKLFYPLSIAIFALGLIAMLVGFGMRIAISGRAPVTDMYESVIYVGLGTAVFGLIFEVVYRKKYILAAAAAVSTLVLILADNCPAVLDPSLRPLQPVLRSNFWLTTHVMTITLSYAAFALALGISNITLGYFLVGAGRREAVAALSHFTYRCLQVGVLLLAVGIILGGVWAAYSWGRFWGWDPKETWALIALLGYLAVFHARFLGWTSDLGLAALSVVCFCLVVMAWYGVNFVLGVGLHSYGFGANQGQLYVGTAIALQLIYLGAAVMRGVESR